MQYSCNIIHFNSYIYKTDEVADDVKAVGV